MMSKSKYLLLSLLLLLLVGGCSGDRKKLYPYGWTTLDAEYDSLTLKLERAYLTHAPSEQIDSLTILLDKAAAKHPDSDLHRSRRHYWDGRSLLRSGDEKGAFREFAAAIEMTDSARYPYDVARVRWNMEGDMEFSPETYRYLQSRIEFFKEQGELPLQADYLMTLGSMMNTLGDPQSGLRYYTMADSVMKLYGDADNLVKNRINHATALAQSGDEPKASQVLREVLESKALEADPFAEEITNWDLYLYSGDMEALRKAYANALKDTVGNVEYLKLYEGMLMKEFALRGETDSAAFYARKADARDVEWSIYNYGKDFALGRGHAAMAAGEHDAAAKWFLSAVEIADSIARDDLDSRISSLDTQRRIAEFNHQEEMAHARSRIRMLVVVILLILLASVVVVILIRRLQRQRIVAMEEKLRKEHSMRKVMGLQIAMSDNDRLVGELREIAESMPSDTAAAAAARQKMLDVLKSNTIANSSRESFLTTFSEISPGFTSRLAAGYPDLTDAERRLATLIALGLDTKHIARLLNVRQESVKQARWRLRGKMALEKDRNLDELLRSMVDDPEG